MRFMLRRSAFALILVGFGTTRFQSTTNPSHYARLFPAPTGQNGYEQFALAADLANSSEPWQEYEHTGNDSLDLKRRVLADPLNRRALEAVRAGLKKPIVYPHRDEELTTLLPEMKDFRSVGRLIKTEMEVRLADGQTAQALDCLDDALNFGHSIQVGAVTSGVVGLLVENTILKSFSQHLGKLSLQDCNKLTKITNKHLALKDVLIGIVSRERDVFARTMKNHRSDAFDLMNTLDPGPNTTEPVRNDFIEVREMLRRRPENGPELMDRMVELIESHFNATLGELKRSVWERNYPIAQDRSSPAARLLFTLCPRCYDRIGDRFATERTLLQILGVHAAVSRYRILNKHLPNDLKQVHLGSIGIDVFTGNPLKFTSLGMDAYEISSAGPFDHGDGKRAPAVRRTPITVKYPNSD